MSESGSSSSSSSSSAGLPSPLIEQSAPVNLDASLLASRRVVRAGAAIKSVLTLLCGATMLLTAAAVLDPATLQARSVGPAPVDPPRDAHQEFTMSLAGLISQCQRVLAVNPAHDRTGTQIVLWADDRRDPGRINADELAVVAHNPMFQAITVYSVPQRGPAAAASANAPVWRGVRPGAAASASAPRETDLPIEAMILTQADLVAAGAIDRWQAHPGVTARVVSTGITGMSLEPAAAGDRWAAGTVEGNKAPSTLSLFRLRLTYSSDSSDGVQSATALVESGRNVTQSATAPQNQNSSSRRGDQEYHP